MLNDICVVVPTTAKQTPHLRLGLSDTNNLLFTTFYLLLGKFKEAKSPWNFLAPHLLLKKFFSEYPYHKEYEIYFM